MFDHSKRESLTHGNSPGNGITPIPLSRDPLATEGEATPGPDDWNPYDEAEDRRALREMGRELEDDPTSGDDPYSFDDVGDGLMDTIGGEFGFAQLTRDGPQF